MANPTTNYNFAMPTNSDLVKDLPADFEVFGQAVDTQMKTNADAAIAKSLVTTKGDLIAATGASTPARLAVGTNDQVLIADSTAATGLKWGTAPSGGITQIATTTASASASVTFSSIPSTYKNLYVIYENFIPVSNGDFLTMRFNGVSSTSYQDNTIYGNANDYNFNLTSIQVSSAARNSSAAGMGYIFIPYYATTTSMKMCDTYSFVRSSVTAANMNVRRSHSLINSTSAISSISFQSPAATFSGVFTLFGVQ